MVGVDLNRECIKNLSSRYQGDEYISLMCAAVSDQDKALIAHNGYSMVGDAYAPTSHYSKESVIIAQGLHFHHYLTK